MFVYRASELGRRLADESYLTTMDGLPRTADDTVLVRKWGFKGVDLDFRIPILNLDCPPFPLDRARIPTLIVTA